MGNTTDLYTGHFGLTERPFSLVPNPDFLFWSDAHARAFSMLEYGLMTRAPITLITGEVGTGKTTLVHRLLTRTDDDMTVGLIANAHGDRGELLRWVLLALAQPTDTNAGYTDLFAQFQTYLVSEYAAGRRVVLIFDEAQNLTRDMLEELRMFTNINSGRDELLQLVLVGQPELRSLVQRPDLRQFAQRVAASFHLPEMDATMVDAYISHRLQVAGASYDIFQPDAARIVHAATGGIARLVNQLCDLALVYAFTMDEPQVSAAIVRQVLTDGVFFAGGMPAPASLPTPEVIAPARFIRSQQRVAG